MKLKFGNRVVDPLVDFPFKKILGSTEHKNLTLHFLNAVMEALDLPRFADLEILNPFSIAEFEHEKEIELDIHAPSQTSCPPGRPTPINPNPDAPSPQDPAQ